MNDELIGLFASSEDATKVSMRIQALIVGASAVIIGFAAAVLHVQLSATDVVSLGSGLGMVAGSIMFVLGVAKWLIQKFGKKSPLA